MLTIVSCGKKDLSNRGEPIFRNVDKIYADSSLEDVEVEIDEAGSLSAWVNGDYDAELAKFNHKFNGDFDISKRIAISDFMAGVGGVKFLPTALPNNEEKQRNRKLNFTRFIATLKYIYVDMPLKQPLVFDDKIAFYNKSGIIKLLDITKNYKEVWQFPIWEVLQDDMKNINEMSINYGDGKIFFTTSNGYIGAINADNGSLQWMSKFDMPFRSPAKYYNNRLFVNSNLNITMALDATNGEEIWQKSDTETPKCTMQHPSVLIGQSSIISAYSSGNITAIDINTGNTKWLYDVATPSSSAAFSLTDIDITPAFVDGYVLTGGVNGAMYLIRESDGKVMWIKNYSLVGQVAISGDFAFFIDNKDALLCINWQTGAIKWRKQLPAFHRINVAKYLSGSGDLFINKYKSKSGPALINDQLIILTSTGELIIIDPQTGEDDAVLATAHATTNLTIVNGVIYAISAAENNLIIMKGASATH